MTKQITVDLTPEGIRQLVEVLRTMLQSALQTWSAAVAALGAAGIDVAEIAEQATAESAPHVEPEPGIPFAGRSGAVWLRTKYARLSGDWAQITPEHGVFRWYSFESALDRGMDPSRPLADRQTLIDEVLPNKYPNSQETPAWLLNLAKDAYLPSPAVQRVIRHLRDRAGVVE